MYTKHTTTRESTPTTNMTIQRDQEYDYAPYGTMVITATGNLCMKGIPVFAYDEYESRMRDYHPNMTDVQIKRHWINLDAADRDAVIQDMIERFGDVMYPHHASA
mgnify:CR=1 FL=1